MITITLLLLCILFAYLSDKYYEQMEVHLIFSVLFGVMFLFSLLVFSFRAYDYGEFVSERNAFCQTLENARESGNEIELAAISKDIAEWNSSLASKNFARTTIFKEYTDPRFEDLEPIK